MTAETFLTVLSLTFSHSLSFSNSLSLPSPLSLSLWLYSFLMSHVTFIWRAIWLPSLSPIFKHILLRLSTQNIIEAQIILNLFRSNTLRCYVLFFAMLFKRQSSHRKICLSMESRQMEWESFKCNSVSFVWLVSRLLKDVIKSTSGHCFHLCNPNISIYI